MKKRNKMKNLSGMMHMETKYSNQFCDRFATFFIKKRIVTESRFTDSLLI